MPNLYRRYTFAHPGHRSRLSCRLGLHHSSRPPSRPGLVFGPTKIFLKMGLTYTVICGTIHIVKRTSPLHLENHIPQHVNRNGDTRAVNLKSRPLCLVQRWKQKSTRPGNFLLTYAVICGIIQESKGKAD